MTPFVWYFCKISLIRLTGRQINKDNFSQRFVYYFSLLREATLPILLLLFKEQNKI